MNKKKIKFFGKLQFGLELMLTAASLVAAARIQNAGKVFLFDPDHYMFRIDLLVLIIPIWGFTFHYFGAYRYLHKKRIELRLRPLLNAIATSGILLFASLAILKIGVSRLLIVIFLVIDCGLLTLERWLLLRFMRSMIPLMNNLQSVIIVGINRRAEALVDLIKTHNEWGIRIVGLINCGSERAIKEIPGVPEIGRLADIEEILFRLQVDEVIFVVPRKMIDELGSAVALCQRMGIRFRFSADLFEHSLGRVGVEQICGLPIITYEPTRHPIGGVFAKRVFDIVVSLLALVALFPLLLTIAAAIKISSPGPVFFLQERCGLNRKRFRMIKFRTMVKNAEVIRTALVPLNEMAGPVFKISGDPRITPVGWFLRKYSLDELPQFLNVLSGDMSVVGPRPPIPSEVNEYDPSHIRRLSVRPGITCLWQVSGRNQIPFERWMDMDLEYIDRWSFWLDLKIIIRTVPVMIGGTGL